MIAKQTIADIAKCAHAPREKLRNNPLKSKANTARPDSLMPRVSSPIVIRRSG
jgi:hypothetical protein